MKTISFKVSDEEELQIRREARKAGTTVSEYLRQCIRGENSQITVEKSKATGAPSFFSGDSGPRFSTADVNEILADFP